MPRVPDATLDYLDALGWCSCTPPKDHCEDCRRTRALQRQQPDPTPRVFTGAPVKKQTKFDLG